MLNAVDHLDKWRQLVAEETAFVSTVTRDVEKERHTPRLIALLFCDYANLTQDGKPNLLGIFDRVLVDRDKKKTNVRIFLKLAAVPGDIEIAIFDPDGKNVAGGLLNPTGGERGDDLVKYSQAILVVELETEKKGLYWFDISSDGKSLGGNGIQVDFRSEEESDGSND